jgi:hypothetical protein
MGRITTTGQLPALPERVWSYCKDISHTPEWFPAVISVRAVTDQIVGVGAEYEFTARNAARTVTYRMRVTEWDEGRRVRQEIVPGSGRGLWASLLESMSVVWEYRPSDGGTRLSATQEMKLKGPVDLLTMPWLLVFDRLLYRTAFRRLARIMAEPPATNGGG